MNKHNTKFLASFAPLREKKQIKSRQGARHAKVIVCVAWRKRSVIRESIAKLKNPDFTSLHPGYCNKAQSLMFVVGAALAANICNSRLKPLLRRPVNLDIRRPA